MHLTTQKILGIGLVAFVLAAASYFGLNNSISVSAQSTDLGTPLHGWAFSTTTGWISFNSANVGSGGGPHTVRKYTNGDIKGWAWSSNIGWVKFGDLATTLPANSFPATGSHRYDAKIVDNQLVGWARACAGTMSGTCSTMQSRVDGWDGWIELTGTNHSVTLATSGGTTAMTGWAWGGDVIGWLLFNVTTDAVTEPPVTGGSCTISSSRSPQGAYTLTWSSTGLTEPCTSTGFSTTQPNGSMLITPAQGTNNYGLTCQRADAPPQTRSCSHTITVGGPDERPDIQMWVNNDTKKSQRVHKIRPGQDAKINWEINTSELLDDCLIYFGEEDVESVEPADKPNQSPYTKSNLPIGNHTFTMSCMSGQTPIQAMNINSVSQAQSSSLIISVVDPTLEEI